MRRATRHARAAPLLALAAVLLLAPARTAAEPCMKPADLQKAKDAQGQKLGGAPLLWGAEWGSQEISKSGLSAEVQAKTQLEGFAAAIQALPSDTRKLWLDALVPAKVGRASISLS